MWHYWDEDLFIVSCYDFWEWFVPKAFTRWPLWLRGKIYLYLFDRDDVAIEYCCCFSTSYKKLQLQIFLSDILKIFYDKRSDGLTMSYISDTFSPLKIWAHICWLFHHTLFEVSRQFITFWVKNIYLSRDKCGFASSVMHGPQFKNPIPNTLITRFIDIITIYIHRGGYFRKARGKG